MNHEQRFMSSLLLFFLLHPCTSIDTITSNQSISDGDLLVSSGENFALGFFSPGNSGNRYVGIWYHKVPEQTVVWVANRDHPINDTTGVLSVNQTGNLVLHAQDTVFWSSNVSTTSTKNCTAQLLDLGNLVLVQSDKRIWQSFDYPTDTMLPFMKLGLDRKTGIDRFLTSWKSRDDPGTGDCSYRFKISGSPQLFLYKDKGTTRWWRTGPWNGLKWSGVAQMTNKFIFNRSFANNDNEISIMYGITNSSIFSRLMVNESGSVQWFTWHEAERQWNGFWWAPKDQCDIYSQCGANGNCNPNNGEDFECTCLPGYKPKNSRDWYLRDGSGGCMTNRVGTSTCGSGDGFVKVERVKVPDTSSAYVDTRMSLKGCEEECLRNCSCRGYTSADVRRGGSGCVTWYGDLTDTRQYTTGGQDLYIRVDAVELAKYAKKSKGFFSKKGRVAILVVSVVVTLFLVASFAYWLVSRKKRKGMQSLTYFDDSPRANELNGSRASADLPFYDLSTIAAATDNFSSAKMLGRGGFGPVYQGQLSNGQEIAVKRLSKTSGQGIEEFKNEVTLIAKLQHRNLVRLLGCCIQKEEKMLIYEFLPNKSLDSFIFDETKRSLLDWRKRFEIICGIARGMLYLHQDSRLRIIHRDLKASNVLLDATLKPKISDFGLARMFGGDQIEGNTNRVVGTYGYMSPEYAMEGLYSVKSDVYSFGVLLLEIITGKKNSGFYHENPSSNLVGHIWDLWREGTALDMVDSSMGESYPAYEVLRCIQIGLLCVQESATDRPTMLRVVFMLGNDTSLPSPKNPAFIVKRGYNSTSTMSEGTSSVNDVTITSIGGR